MRRNVLTVLKEFKEHAREWGHPFRSCLFSKHRSWALEGRWGGRGELNWGPSQEKEARAGAVRPRERERGPESGF